MSTVIVGHDGTQRGDDALALARLLTPGGLAHRIVAHVVDEDQRREAGPPAALDALELLPGEELRILEGGSPGRMLQELVEDAAVSLLVLGPSRHGTLSRVLGTTVERMMNGSPCPVAAAVPGTAGSELRRILLAYDGSPEAEAGRGLAADIGRDAGAVVDVVTIHATLPPVDYPGSGGFRPYAARNAQKQAEEIAQGALAALPEALRGEAIVGVPPAGRGIVTEAARTGADLIVMGSRGYGPLRRVLLGSTGSAVAHATPCSLLVFPRAGG